jgi:hypothetical protein
LQKPDGFRIACGDGRIVDVGEVILSAGLARVMRLKSPLRPQRGHG